MIHWVQQKLQNHLRNTLRLNDSTLSDIMSNRTEYIGSVAIFLPGTLVEYNTKTYTVDHVSVSTNILSVYLVGMATPVESHLLKCNPTALYTVPRDEEKKEQFVLKEQISTKSLE